MSVRRIININMATVSCARYTSCDKSQCPMKVSEWKRKPSWVLTWSSLTLLFYLPFYSIHPSILLWLSPFWFRSEVHNTQSLSYLSQLIPYKLNAECRPSAKYFNRQLVCVCAVWVCVYCLSGVHYRGPCWYQAMYYQSSLLTQQVMINSHNVTQTI